jgi:hypothetical protein
LVRRTERLASPEARGGEAATPKTIRLISSPISGNVPPNHDGEQPVSKDPFDRWRPKPDSKPDPEPETPDEDSYDDPSGDGRTSRHQVFGVQLIDERKQLCFIPYAAVIFGLGTFNGTTFTFEFARGEHLWEATITGTLDALQRIVDKFTTGKRVSIRANGDTVTAVTWRRVTAKGEED